MSSNPFLNQTDYLNKKEQGNTNSINSNKKVDNINRLNNLQKDDMNYSVSLLNDDGNQQFQSSNHSRVISLNKSKKLKCNWWIITLSVVLSLLLLVGLGFIIYFFLRDNIIVKNEFDF